MKNFAHSEADRLDFVKEMLAEAAGNTKAARAQLLAIEDLRSWYANGEQGPEPEIDDIEGLSWEMACRISSDLHHIFRAERPEGVYGSEYERTFIKARRQQRAKTARRQAVRNASGLDQLRAALII